MGRLHVVVHGVISKFVHGLGTVDAKQDHIPFSFKELRNRGQWTHRPSRLKLTEVSCSSSSSSSSMTFQSSKGGMLEVVWLSRRVWSEARRDGVKRGVHRGRVAGIMKRVLCNINHVICPFCGVRGTSEHNHHLDSKTDLSAGPQKPAANLSGEQLENIPVMATQLTLQDLRQIPLSDLTDTVKSPEQKIRYDEDVARWKQTIGYQDYRLFLCRLNEAVVGYTVPRTSDQDAASRGCSQVG